MENMTNRVGWKFINGQKVFNIDFSGLCGETLLNHLLFCCLETQKINEKTKFLINYSNSKMSMDLLSYTLEAAKNIQPHVEKSAILGIEGFKRKLFSVYKKFTGSNAQLFDQKEKAISFLVE